MKMPEKIKLGIRLCTLQTAGDNCKGCPYRHEGSLCRERLATDLLGYTYEIESTVSQVKKALSDNGFSSLEAFLQSYNQVKAERDAAVRDLAGITNEEYLLFGVCAFCKNSKFEWRGVLSE